MQRLGRYFWCHITQGKSNGHLSLHLLLMLEYIDILNLNLWLSSCHWMLTVVNPDEEIVHFMDPLKRRLVTGEWRNIVDK